jgi:hypothetical protein
MFVNKIPFFITISRDIKFGTTEVLPNQKSTALKSAMTHVLSIYRKRGFRLTIILMNGQFEPLCGDLANLQLTLNTVSNDEHVPEVERHIRTVKERTRCVYNTLPFKRLPVRLTIESISDTLSPRAIVVGSHVDYTKHCQLEFGSSVQTHEEHDNSMATRTTGAIALRPTGNAQGGHLFLSLATGRVLNRNRWMALPMPAEVIDCVHVLARRNNSPLGLTFLDHAGAALIDFDLTDTPDDNSDDEDYDPADDLDPDDDDDDAATDSDDDDDDSTAFANDDNGDPADAGFDAAIDPPPAPAANFPAMADELAGVPELEPEPAHDAPIARVYDAEPPDGTAINDNNTDGDTVGANDNDDENNGANAIEQVMNTKYGPRQSEYDLRPRRPRDYSHLHTTLEGIAMTQHSMKKEIKLFGQAGVDAVSKELQQLHNHKVLEPKSPDQISSANRRDALQYLMFLKKKCNGIIKGRGCADGRKQCMYTAKEDASSPMVAIESVMLSCVINAMEQRDIATVDIPGAFMQADMDELVHVKLEGKMAKLLVLIDPKLYRKHVRIEKGKQILYVELRKARLYGTLRALLLFWRLLTKRLKSWGFEANPYDWCVANKTINGKQCTILWHVDDLKISHVDPVVVTDVINRLEKVFGIEGPLTKTRGSLHDYLGMTLDFSSEGKVKSTMVDYIQNMLDELPSNMDGEAATPAANHLFDVNDATADMLLNQETAELYHHNVAKLLFLCKRARPDIQTAVSFLCTRVKNPDTDDYKKLMRVMRYLRGTLNMPLTLEANDVRVIKWHIDAAFAVHPDMKGHTGGNMTLGKGSVYGTSTQQKINTRSSTEAELISVNDIMPQVLWTRYFLSAQGYDTTENIVYQDNQSAILLEKNGKGSSSKRTHHIDIRYFFVTDRVASKEVSIEYCPTRDMVADFFTKPLQGSQFKKFRNLIMKFKMMLPPLLVLGITGVCWNNQIQTYTRQTDGLWSIRRSYVSK